MKDKDFFEVSDWFHFAIVELIKAKKGSVNLNDVRSRLKLSETEARFALKSLVGVGLLKTTGQNRFSAPDSYEMPSISSEGIRKFHTQTLQLALRSIVGQPMSSRELRSLTLAFDKKRMLEVREYLSKFVAGFEKKFASGERDSVYQLNLSLYQTG